MKAHDRVAEVQRVAEIAMEQVIEYIVNDDCPTAERAHEIIDQVLVEHNYEAPSGHIVSSGLQTADPHAIGSGRISANGPILIDIFPRSKTSGYWGDITRTISIGEPNPRILDMYETVLEAQQLAFNLIKPGAVCNQIHTAVSEYFNSKGYLTSGNGKEFKYLEGFVHSLGHGVGVQIHQSPRVGDNSQDNIKVGDVITIEPGLYYQDVGGVRIEDTIVVTANGYQNLTNFSKQFIYT